MYFAEAFKALDCLTEDTFSTSPADLAALQGMQDDDITDEVEIYDVTAATQEELSDSYIGKVILDCCTCHSLFYKAPDEIIIDEEQDVANVDEECPICASVGGYKIIGEVAPFSSTESEEEQEDEESAEVQEEDTVLESLSTGKEDLEEPLEEGIFGIKTKKEKAAEERARKEREAKKKADKEAEKERELARQQFAADSWASHDKNKRDAEREYNRNRHSSIKGDKPSNTGYRGVSYSGGDYYSESLNESTKDIDAIIAKMKSHVREWGRFRTNNEGVRFVSIEDDLAQYISRDKFDDYILKTLDSTSDIDDIIDDIPWEHTIGIHHAFETDEYRDEKKALNHKYGFSRASRTQVNESIKDLSLTTDDTKLEMTSDEDGKVTVTSEPIAKEETSEEIIASVSDETVEVIDRENTEDAEQSAEDEVVDIEMEEFDEESFDELGESFLRERYDNVTSFKTLSINEADNKMIIEGVVGFTSGKKGKTTFVFEGFTATKDNNVVFKGFNKELHESGSSLELQGKVEGTKLIAESLVLK